MSAQINQYAELARKVPGGKPGSIEREAYRRIRAEIEQQVKEFLADEYASDFTPAQQAALWAKAYADGHAAGYEEIETHYMDLAEFVSIFRG